MFHQLSKEELSTGMYVRIRMMNSDELRHLCDQLAEVAFTLPDAREEAPATTEPTQSPDLSRIQQFIARLDGEDIPCQSKWFRLVGYVDDMLGAKPTKPEAHPNQMAMFTMEVSK